MCKIHIMTFVAMLHRTIKFDWEMFLTVWTIYRLSVYSVFFYLLVIILKIILFKLFAIAFNPPFLLHFPRVIKYPMMFKSV